MLSELSSYGKDGVGLFNKISGHIDCANLGFGYKSYLIAEKSLSSGGIRLSHLESIWLAIAIGKIEGFKDPLTSSLRREIIPVIDRTLISSYLTRDDFLGLALIYIDLDKFGEINKLYSQRSGDLILKTVAKNLEESIREVDILIRMGGDEFLIILPKLEKEGGELKFNEVIERFSGEGFSAGEIKLSSETENTLIEIKGSSGFSYMDKSAVREVVTKDHVSAVDKLSIVAGEELMRNKKIDRKLHIRSVPRDI